MNEPTPMDRRAFIVRLPMVAGIAAGAAAVGTTGCAGAAYLTPTRSGSTLTVPASAVGEGQGVFVVHPGDERPVYLHRGAEGLTAVHARCTHRGCQPDPVADRLVCPCHGSEFGWDGSLLEGPAERPLPRFPVREENGRIFIDVGRQG